VLIDLIQLRVELEPDSAAPRKLLLELGSSPSAVALAQMELWRVDLDQAHARSVRQPDRVTVDAQVTVPVRGFGDNASSELSPPQPDRASTSTASAGAVRFIEGA
jgi:hypothetical protein